MLTLIEQSKLKQNPLEAGIIETFASTSPVLQLLPFKDVAGNAYSWNTEDTLPGIAFRDYNESYTESTGVVQTSTETLKIMGGTSKVDRALVKTQGNLNSLRAEHDAMKAKAGALYFTKNFFKGDVETEAKGFDGLEKRLTGTQVIDNGSTTLDLKKLDELVDAVKFGADALFMSKAMRRQVLYAAREMPSLIEVLSDNLGKNVTGYAGVPIYAIEDDNDGNEILGATEGDSGNETSIYAVRFGSDAVCGLQAGGMDVIDLGLNGIHYETLIEWISSFTIFHPKAAARLKGITLS